MTDKQIIIDECNVSECKHFNGYQRIVRNNECIVDMQNACIEEIKTKPCSQKHNCYFKNWQRKEQECEELKNTVDYLRREFKKQKQINNAISRSCENLNCKDLQKLKAENEELKKMLKDLSYENQKFCYQIEEQTKQLEPFKDEYFKSLDNVTIAGLAKKSIRITAENSKLEQTLTEIKEFCIDHTQLIHDAYPYLNIILDKINEVEGEKNNS